MKSISIIILFTLTSLISFAGIETNGKIILKLKNDIWNLKSLTQSTNQQEEVRYIKFKIKNNSFNRNHFYVVGPKPNGGKFSYGFPMMPGQIRKETWTTGTKIYKTTKLGLRKLLVTIKADDENQVVKLFRK